MIYDEDHVRAALVETLEELIRVDLYLLDANCSERSVTHQFAVHLSKHFKGYQVDCEYNRDGFNAKKLQLSEREVQVGDDALDAVTVFPDVIVHLRGRKDSNLLVVEIKKASSSVSHSYDIEKLKAFKSELDYAFAVHIVIGYKDGTLVNELSWQ